MQTALFRPTVLMAMALMAVIVMMVLPVPSWVLDLGLAASFALAILIFTTTLFIEEPLEFSAFPTILLASLMLRLSLNVSSTKLIIGQGHTGTDAAGDVISGFADFVMGGSVFLGLVVFGVLMIVNFTVITKGATRMAEVGARFALDAMPGKQLAIDADMAAGAITHAQASSRRQRDQQETTFFGSLDGASKFVKGDAIAGLLITLLNLVVGMMMGIIVHQMPFSKAFETYAILTVGDGLVTQLPAVIISIASALLLARGGNKGAADVAIAVQLLGRPAAVATVAILMALFAFVPGLPFVPFMIATVILTFLAYRKYQSERFDLSIETPDLEPKSEAFRPIADVLEIDDIHIEFAPDLVDMILDPATGIDARINNMRNHIATQYGLILPEIRLTDNVLLPRGTYLILIHGVEQVRGTIYPSQMLALASDLTELPAGHDVSEPVYGAPARWIASQERESAAISGATIVTASEVLSTHMLETVKRNLSRLLTLRALRRLMEEMVNLSDPRHAEANRKLIEELIPERLQIDVLHAVLKLLLEEQVSIRNLPLILETAAEGRAIFSKVEQIAEHVRQRLGFQLIAPLRRPDGSLPLVQLSPEWEEIFLAHQFEPERGSVDVALPPDMFNKLGEHTRDVVATLSSDGVSPALVTTARRRRYVRTILAAKGLSIPVLSFDEIGLDARPSLVGTVPA